MTVDPTAAIPDIVSKTASVYDRAEAGERERQRRERDDRDPRHRHQQHYLANTDRVPRLTEPEHQAQPAEHRDGRAHQKYPIIVVVVGEIDNRRQQHRGAEETDDHSGEKEHRPQIDRRGLSNASG